LSRYEPDERDTADALYGKDAVRHSGIPAVEVIDSARQNYYDTPKHEREWSWSYVQNVMEGQFMYDQPPPEFIAEVKRQFKREPHP